MLALALTALFGASALLATGTLTETTWRRRRAIIALRGELQRCPELRVVSYRIVSREVPVRPVARVLALPVRQTRPAVRPVPGLRAAA